MSAVQLSADQVLTTTRAVRKRLDLARSVPRSVLLECVKVATHAPSGSNRQGWHFVFVADNAPKQTLAELYRRAFDKYMNMPTRPYPVGDIRAEQAERVRDSAAHLALHLEDVPVLLVPCAEGRVPKGSAPWVQATFYGSILPAVWSFMLAARVRGLGTAWTTLHLAYEREAAEILDIPYARYTQVALVPVAYTIGTDFEPAVRLEIDPLTHFDRW